MSYNPSHHILVEWEMTIQVGCSCACSTCCLNLHHVPAAILREGNSHQHYCNKAVHKWQKLQNSTTQAYLAKILDPCLAEEPVAACKPAVGHPAQSFVYAIPPSTCSKSTLRAKSDFFSRSASTLG